MYDSKVGQEGLIADDKMWVGTKRLAAVGIGKICARAQLLCTLMNETMWCMREPVG